MAIKDTLKTFGAGLKFLHWGIGLLVIGLLAVGFFMANFMEPSQTMFALYKWHKQLGIVVLIAIVVRMGWRMMNVRPAYLGPNKKWEIVAAKAVHYLFYAALIAMPLSGWMMSSAKGFSVSFFGMTLPNFIDPSDEMAGLTRAVHAYVAYSLLVLLTLHVGGVLKHVVIYKDQTLRRMLPFVKMK